MIPSKELIKMANAKAKPSPIAGLLGMNQRLIRVGFGTAITIFGLADH